MASCQGLCKCNISKLDKLSNNLEATDNKFGGCTLEQEGNDFYITGADAVRKNWVMTMLECSHCHFQTQTALIRWII